MKYIEHLLNSIHDALHVFLDKGFATEEMFSEGHFLEKGDDRRTEQLALAVISDLAGQATLDTASLVLAPLADLVRLPSAASSRAALQAVNKGKNVSSGSRNV